MISNMMGKKQKFYSKLIKTNRCGLVTGNVNIGKEALGSLFTYSVHEQLISSLA